MTGRFGLLLTLCLLLLAGCTPRDQDELKAVAEGAQQTAIARGNAEAIQLLSVALQIANLQDMTGAADCYNLAQ